MGGRPVGYLQEQPRSWTRGYQEQHQVVVRTGFEPATYGFQIRRYNRSATLPPSHVASEQQGSNSTPQKIKLTQCLQKSNSALTISWRSTVLYSWESVDWKMKKLISLLTLLCHQSWLHTAPFHLHTKKNWVLICKSSGKLTKLKV